MMAQSLAQLDFFPDQTLRSSKRLPKVPWLPQIRQLLEHVWLSKAFVFGLYVVLGQGLASPTLWPPRSDLSNVLTPMSLR